MYETAKQEYQLQQSKERDRNPESLVYRLEQLYGVSTEINLLIFAIENNLFGPRPLDSMNNDKMNSKVLSLDERIRMLNNVLQETLKHLQDLNGRI